MKSNHLLLKAFTISLFIHIVGFSLFSIVFPLSSPSRKPIEVSLLPPSMDKKIQLEKTDIIPELPVLKTKFENIASFDRREVIKISKRVFTGSADYVPLTKITDTFKIPEFKIKFPPLPSMKTHSLSSKEKSTEKIEGPAGERKLIYRERIQYPEWAEKKGIEGNIKIKFWVSPDGKICETEIITSSGYPELDFYTMNKFRRYLFEPINKNKKVWGIITFIFRLK